MNIKLLRFSSLLQSLVAIVFLLLAGNSQAFSQTEIIYAGGSSTRGNKGIYVLQYDRVKAQLTELQTLNEGTSPNFLTISPDKKHLYAVYGKGSTAETETGAVMSFSIDPSTGFLKKLNEQSVNGRGPAHVSIDPKQRFAYVSNYGDGTLSVYPLNKDGSIGTSSDFVKHTGSSIVVGRQETPHVHSTIPSADGRFIYVSDLGKDKIMIYEVTAAGKLVAAKVPFVSATPGSGPRHFAIHPNGNFAYSAQEISSTIQSYKVQKSDGSLTPIERLHMIPSGFTERNSAADIHFSPDGKFLYASNRGHESLVIYKVDPKTGKLSLVGHEGTGGKHPRNFMIDNKGEFALTANQNTDNVVIFRRDKLTGKLTPTGGQMMIPAVQCVIML